MKTPKEVYYYARKLKVRYEEGEKILIRPYSHILKKFVTNSKEYDSQMFMWGIAYLRNILKRSSKLIIDDYCEKLEKQLLKHFEAHNVFNYYSAIKKRLSEELHNRVVLEAAMTTDYAKSYWLKEYLELSNEKKIYSGSCLSKSQEAHNYLVKNPNASDQELIKDLRKRGIELNKVIIKKVRNKLI